MMFYYGRPQVHKQPVPRGVAAPSQRYWIDIFLKDQWAIQGNDTMEELKNGIDAPGRVLVVGDGWSPIPVVWSA